ncbi:hypothetical protein EH183_39045 [Streptomyces sp. CB01881]|nr:hypothetical protein C2142_39055 [Streptomyces sp. CB01881]TYC68842.1 hypothetical protein EH183_39045 [Streptomyces sp. CB01881]
MTGLPVRSDVSVGRVPRTPFPVHRTPCRCARLSPDLLAERLAEALFEAADLGGEAGARVSRR